MCGDIKHDHRRFLRDAVMAVAAAELGMIGSADAQSTTIVPIKPGANTSFGPLEQIDAGLLNIGYAEAGPAKGPAVTPWVGASGRSPAARPIEEWSCGGQGWSTQMREREPTMWVKSWFEELSLCAEVTAAKAVVDVDGY